MNISKKDLDTLNAEITISIGPADYEEKYNEGVKKIRKQVTMPGFRQGKVPEGLIKKQYGTSILVEEINKLLSESLYKFIEENKLDVLGNPLPKEKTPVDFEHQKEFEFTYHLGLAPQFSVDLSNGISLNYKTVKVDDALIDKYIKDLQKNYGQPVNPETASEKDVVFVDINELDESGDIKAGGVFKSTSVGLDRLKNENTKTKLLGIKKEDAITLNVNELYETALDKSVSLGIDKELAENFNSNLKLTVKNIARLEEAEVNQALFDKIYSPNTVVGEEAFREKIRTELGLMFQADADRFFQQEVEKKMVEKLSLSLPDEFLKNWLMAANDKPLKREDLEKEYPMYAKSMQWKLIENKIIKDHQITVTAEEAAEEAKNYIRSEYARYGQQASEEDLAKISAGILEKEKEAEKIYQGLYSRKVLSLIKNTCTLNALEVSYEEFFAAN